MEQTVEEKLRVLRPIIGQRKTEALRALYFSEDDPLDRRRVELRIDSVISRYAKTDIDRCVVLPPPKSSDLGGAVPVGNVEYLGNLRGTFSLKLRDVNRHLGIFGATGSGKTTLATSLIRSLAGQGIRVIVLDWEKNYRGLAKEIAGLVVFTVGTSTSPLFHNPLALPPGIEYEEFAKSIVQIISHDYLGGHGSDTIMLEKIIKCYEHHKAPTFSDLSRIIYEEIEVLMRSGALRGRRGLWQETVHRMDTFMRTGCARLTESMSGRNAFGCTRSKSPGRTRT
jgi:hypothetical protein